MITSILLMYIPQNAQPKLARLEYRMQWEDDFRRYLNDLDEKKPVIVCGDLNVAHNEIDLKILNQIGKILDLAMKKEENSLIY